MKKMTRQERIFEIETKLNAALFIVELCGENDEVYGPLLKETLTPFIKGAYDHVDKLSMEE